MGTNIPFRTLADYIQSVNKVESEKVAWQCMQAINGYAVQANYEFVSRNGMRIPCHNRATQLYYKTKERTEWTIKP